MRRGPEPRSKGKRRRPSWRRVKMHLPYTIDQAAKVTGLAKGTLRRWIRAGTLPAIADKRPHYILGADLKAHLASKKEKRAPMPLHLFRCFKCKAQRTAALGMADYVPLTERTGNLVALCEPCGTTMHKIVARRRLAELEGVLEVILQQGPERLMDSLDTPSDDHFEQRGPADA